MARLLIAVILLLISSAAYAQQDPDDHGYPDSVLIEIVLADETTGGDLPFLLEVHYFNDADSLKAASTKFTWDNPNVLVDSARLLPVAAESFDFFQYLFPGGLIDTANIYRQITCAHSSLYPPHFPAAPSRQLVATYYFSCDRLDTGTNSKHLINPATLAGVCEYRRTILQSRLGRTILLLSQSKRH